jgi:hypothetical protein
MNKSEESASSMERLVGKVMGLGDSQEELAKFFRENGMHASRASEVILNGVRKKRSRIMVGTDAKLMDLAQRLTPMHYEKLFPLFTLPLTLFRNKKPIKGMPVEEASPLPEKA